jgi:hypothetical protein
MQLLVSKDFFITQFCELRNKNLFLKIKLDINNRIYTYGLYLNSQYRVCACMCVCMYMKKAVGIISVCRRAKRHR